LRTLRERTGRDILPLWMDAATFAATRDRALAMRGDELELVTSLAGRWDEPYGGDLLAALAASGVWIEQEAVIERLLGLDRADA